MPPKDDDALREERDQFVRELVDSNAFTKVAVAGPGTGKSYAFKRLLSERDGEKLVLSFINNLVRDLKTALNGLAEVQTLHGFARALLHKHGAHGVSRGCDYYPSLSVIQGADGAIMLGHGVSRWDVEGVLHQMDDQNEILQSAMHSGIYYDAVGHTDSVYRVVRYLAAHPEDVPRYAQLVVDEFQDFSWLEVSLIRELAAISPTLVVGDDDQALYDFKHASPQYLRDLAAGDDVARFELPFCSRCTDVLVEGVRRIVAEAQARGLLSGRVGKPYECFMPTKRVDSERYPKIIHAECSVERNGAAYICRYVERMIGQVPPEDIADSAKDDYPTVLVIGPAPFNRRVSEYLIERGVPNVTPPRRSGRDLDILDGYRRLARKSRSRLGWRILVHLDDPGSRNAVVRQALDSGDDLVDLLPGNYRDQHLEIAALVAKVRADEALTYDERAQLETAVARTLEEIRRQLGMDEDEESEAPTVAGAPTVVVTSFPGAKGLQAAHVFVVGMNEHHFPDSNAAPTDHEVCCMLVALTRATKICHLVSCKRLGGRWLQPSVFIAWLGDLVTPLQVDVSYFAP